MGPETGKAYALGHKTHKKIDSSVLLLTGSARESWVSDHKERDLAGGVWVSGFRIGDC